MHRCRRGTAAATRRAAPPPLRHARPDVEPGVTEMAAGCRIRLELDAATKGDDTAASPATGGPAELTLARRGRTDQRHRASPPRARRSRMDRRVDRCSAVRQRDPSPPTQHPPHEEPGRPAVDDIEPGRVLERMPGNLTVQCCQRLVATDHLVLPVTAGPYVSRLRPARTDARPQARPDPHRYVCRRHIRPTAPVLLLPPPFGSSRCLACMWLPERSVLRNTPAPPASPIVAGDELVGVSPCGFEVHQGVDDDVVADREM